MYTENQIVFTDELLSRIGFYLWMHSVKCKRIRIGFYIATLVSSLLFLTGVIRQITTGAGWSMTLVFFFLTLVLFAAIVVIWPLVFRSKSINSIQKEIPQIVTMDSHFVNLHTSVSHEKYKWHIFNDIEEDERYYMLFSPSVYIVLDKKTFPAGGEEIFRRFRVPDRLLKNAKGVSKRSKYLMLFTHDYLTPLVGFRKSVFHKN